MPLEKKQNDVLGNPLHQKAITELTLKEIVDSWEILQEENNKLLQYNIEVSKGFRGKILNLMGVRFQTKFNNTRVLDEKATIKKCWGAIKFCLIFVFFLTITNLCAWKLGNESVTVIGLLGFIISLLVGFFVPNDNRDIFKVLRFLGDLATASLVYTSLNSLHLMPGNRFYLVIISCAIYIFVAIRFYRDVYLKQNN